MATTAFSVQTGASTTAASALPVLQSLDLAPAPVVQALVPTPPCALATVLDDVDIAEELARP